MTYTWSRRLIASALTAFILALVVHAANIVAFTAGYLGGATQPGWVSFVQVSDFFALASVFAFVLLAVAGLLGVFSRWWTALIAGFVVALISLLINSAILVASSGGGAIDQVVGYLWNSIGGFNLFYLAALTVLTPTFGRMLYRAFVSFEGRGVSGRRLAFVRVPAANLADGLVTHIDRVEVDTAKADEQWDAYVATLAGAGWQTVEVEPADALADSVFVEDTTVVLGDTAVITNPGAESRRAEIAGTEAAMRAQGMRLAYIQEPGTLDGGDVLQIGDTVYVGRGGRTNADGIRQLRAIAAPLGRTVVAVPNTKALHLKSAVTALPDGTVIGHPATVDDPSLFDRFLAVPEPEGAHVVVLDATTVMMSASAPRSIALIEDLGYRVLAVEIGEFEKLEGCVTCLSVLVR